MSDHGLVVACLDGMMHHPREVGPFEGQQRGQHPSVELQAHGRRQCALDRSASQLVPEGHVLSAYLEHPQALRRRDHGEIVEQAAGKRQLDAGRHDGQSLEPGPGRGVELAHPREHRVDHRERHLLPARGEGLGDEERVAVGQPVQGSRCCCGAAGQARDRRPRQTAQRQSVHRAAGKAAEHPLQRMVPVDLVVAVGHDQHGGQGVHPAPEVAQHVERCLVRPMRVLHHQHRRAAGQLGQQRGEHALPLVAGQGAGQRSVRRPSRIADRPECARRQQVVTGAGQDPGAPTDSADERPYHGGLADPRLAEQQHHRAGSDDGTGEGRVQHAQLLVAFQQPGPHAGIVPRAAAK